MRQHACCNACYGLNRSPGRKPRSRHWSQADVVLDVARVVVFFSRVNMCVHACLGCCEAHGCKTALVSACKHIPEHQHTWCQPSTHQVSAVVSASAVQYCSRRSAVAVSGLSACMCDHMRGMAWYGIVVHAYLWQPVRVHAGLGAR